jgi:hypothetical protein
VARWRHRCAVMPLCSCSPCLQATGLLLTAPSTDITRGQAAQVVVGDCHCSASLLVVQFHQNPAILLPLDDPFCSIQFCPPQPCEPYFCSWPPRVLGRHLLPFLFDYCCPSLSGGLVVALLPLFEPVYEHLWEVALTQCPCVLIDALLVHYAPTDTLFGVAHVLPGGLHVLSTDQALHTSFSRHCPY